MAKEIAKLFITLGMDDKQLSGKLDKVQKNLGQMGKVMTGIGAGITASLGMATKAALDEQIGINQLSQALQNVGSDYSALSVEIEKSLAATQAKTSFGDGPQREALSELVAITGQYEGSLKQLQLATDLAAAKNMDLVSAATLVGRAAIGDTALLKRYGIVVAEGATAVETLTQMQERFGGSAEAMADPIEQIKNYMGDLAEQVGAKLLPTLKSLVDRIIPIIQKVMEWIDANPALVNTLIMITAAIGGVFVTLGPLLMMLPMIASGFTLMLGPVGLAIAAIMGLIAVGVLVKTHWTEIVAFFQSIPEKIRSSFAGFVDFMLAPIKAVIFGIVTAINWIIDKLNSLPKIDLPGLPALGFNISPLSMPTFAVPSMEFGGIVPGPIGQPVPIIAHGGEAFLGVGNKGQSVNVTANVYGWVGTDQQIARKIRDMFLNERNNTAYDLGFA